jgi:hypothetical protein
MRRPLLLLITLALAGCDQLGIESPASTKARVDADGKAIGGACRHAGRAIEDCYTLNKKADKAAIFAGWREMNEYMTENKLDPVVPVIPPEPHKLPRPAKPAPSGAEDAEAEESQPIEKN